jgi:hypothetical protein
MENDDPVQTKRRERTERWKRTMRERNGWQKTAEHKQKLSESQRGERNAFYRTPHTIESLNLIIAAAKRTAECPHCHKVAQARIMKRWHFDNCHLIKPRTLKPPKKQPIVRNGVKLSDWHSDLIRAMKEDEERDR